MSEPDPRRAAVVRRLLVTAGLCVLAVVAVYLAFVCTRRGQDLDDLAYSGRDAVRPRATAATDRLLDSITEQSLAVLGTGLVLVALLRKRWRLAVGVFVAVGGAIVTSEVLKHTLPRPDHAGIQGIPHNSYPSGHATIAMALALGLVISTVAGSQFVAAQLSFLVTFMPALILSGLMFDIASMPRWLQLVTTVFPARYYVSSLQTLFLAGTVWPVLLPDLAALAGFAILLLGVAIARTRRSLE